MSEGKDTVDIVGLFMQKNHRNRTRTRCPTRISTKHVPFSFLLSLVILITLFSSSFPVASTCFNEDIIISQATTLIVSNPSVIVLDVRNQSEYDSGHIRNAKHIPQTELEQRSGDLDKADQILIYSDSDYSTGLARQTLTDNGFTNVHAIRGGISAWVNEGYPVYVKYSSIQEAINNTNEGETIFVASGIYVEHLTLNKSLNLIGEDKETTIIDGATNGTVVHVYAHNLSISNFTFRNSGCACSDFAGVHVHSFHKNISMTNNLIVQNGYGIILDLTDSVIVAHNNITNNECGVRTRSAPSDNFLYGNIIANNSDGIQLWYTSGNSIYGNNIISNVYGVTVYESSNNSIYHNNFLRNTQHVRMVSSCSTNFWDNVLEGNYWSNYEGFDLDHDGIGDTTYTIDENNTDNLPLFGLFHSFNTSIGLTVEVISNSTIEYFEYFQSNNMIKMFVSNMVLDQTHGFCRVCIPKGLIAPDYNVTINNGLIEILHFNNTINDDDTHRWIYFAYEHSTHEIEIVPELPTLSILALLMITLLEVVTYIRKFR